VGNRNTPTIINAALNPSQFWDGRSPSLEDQALEPILNPVEMANTLGGLVARLNTIPGYRGQFKEVFGADTIDADLVVAAIATFERVLLAGDSPVDRWEQKREMVPLGDAARRGAELFRDRARCNRCHLGSNYTDAPFGRFHNLGVGMDSPNPDLGRYGVSGRDEERGAFRTPTLRQVAQTAPYMHDGSLGTLEEVIELYDRGGNANPWLDPEMRPLNLTAREKADLVAFLRALTGEPPAWALRPPRLPPG
jgi:cytochrome c peroxidase